MEYAGTESVESIAARFWPKVDRRGDDECWMWTGAKITPGYGSLGMRERTNVGAHRISWQLHHGPIPDGLWVLHKCDNPPCVNPDHLFLGTQLDNMRDKIRKGRRGDCMPKTIHRGENHWSRFHPERVPRGERSGKYTHPECTPRGEDHGCAKLTNAQVSAIKAELATVTRRYGAFPPIAARYGVSADTIGLIARGKMWKHVK